MSTGSFKKAYVVFGMSLAVATASLAADDTSDSRRRSDRPRQRLSQRLDSVSNRGSDRLQANRERIAQLKKEIEQDRHRLESLQRKLEQVNHTIAERRQSFSDMAAKRKNTLDSAGRRVDAASATRQQRRSDRQSQDTHRAAPSRRRVQQIKTDANDSHAGSRLNSSQRDEIVRRLKERIRIAEKAQEHMFAQALKAQLRKFESVEVDSSARQDQPTGQQSDRLRDRRLNGDTSNQLQRRRRTLRRDTDRRTIRRDNQRSD